LGELCDATLAITAPAAIRVERIMAREGISRAYAQARVNSQHPDEYYIKQCGYSLVNDCESPLEFGERARTLFKQILACDPE